MAADQVSPQDRAEQLVLVFVTLNDAIIDVLFVLQPEGGFYPLVLMQPWAKRVKVEMMNGISAEDTLRLTKYFRNKLITAIDTFQRDLKSSSNTPNSFYFLKNIRFFSFKKTWTRYFFILIFFIIVFSMIENV